MTKKLQEFFNLPESGPDEDGVEINTTPMPIEEVTQEAMNNLEKIDSALPSVRGLDASDNEMDEIAAMAINSYKDLMELGMNVEARVASEILSSASQFLGHAITAKNAKINKKLKMIELQLKKAKLDADLRESGEEQPGQTSTGRALDRNELLAEVLAQARRDEDKKS